MAKQTPIFSVRNEWCAENGWCQEIVLLPSDWDHVTEHVEMEPYCEQIQQALVEPNQATFLDHPTTGIEIAGLASYWRSRRTALIVPTGDYWRFVWVGDKVILKLASFW